MAAVSKTQIANLALSHIRDKGQVENVDTDTTTQAKTARLWYDPARRQALAEFNHGFARSRLALATHSEDPPATWAHRYQWPSDCVQPRYIQNSSGRVEPPVPFELEVAGDKTRSILTDQDEAVLVYTRDEEEVTFFSPHFVLAFSYLLAHYMAGPLTGKQSIQDKTLEKYNLTINTGAAHEANVTAAATDADPDADWIQER